jgi:transposase
MKRLTLQDVETFRAAVCRELRRSHDARYYHRLHGLLLVAGGCSCAEAAELLHEDVRTVQRWIKRFERHGLAGLREGERTGRPPGLSPEQWRAIEDHVRRPPNESGFDAAHWDARLLGRLLQSHFARSFSLRHCQRLLRQIQACSAGA